MREFWVASGHHLTRLRPDGWLDVTDDLLRAWLARPELVPPPEACARETALHSGLRTDPRANVTALQIAALADPDARENWMFLVRFRDLLIGARSVEGAYLEAVRGKAVLPPLFLNHLVQLILRNALDGCGDPFTLRAAELLFRPQRVSVRDGALILADAEIVEDLEAEARHAPLTAMFAAENLDLMSDSNSWTYWSRSDAHAMALNFGGDPKARAGLAAALEAFVRHVLRVDVSIRALTAVTEPEFRWYVGLDAGATALGDALWRGDQPDMQSLVGLFRLDAADPEVMVEAARGRPVYLLMTAADGLVRLKPQNLVTGLPLAVDARAKQGGTWRRN